jgi:hypothetical protein
MRIAIGAEHIRQARLRGEEEDLTEIEQKIGLSRNLSTSVTNKRGLRFEDVA